MYFFRLIVSILFYLLSLSLFSFFFNDTSTTEIYTLSLHDALPIYECSRLLEDSTMKSRRGFATQRLMNAMRQAHADGWFIVFDTLTLADDRLEAFYDNPNALRDYFRDIGRMVLAAEGRKANDSHADCYQYFCVPEYGTANGRLHFHAVHFMRTLPTGSVDPNFGRRVRNR